MHFKERSHIKLERFLKSWIFSRNIYTILFYRILMIMILFSISRIGFYLFNKSMFPDLSLSELWRIMMGGLKFDLSGVLYFNLFYIFFQIIPLEIRYNQIYQRILKYLFFFMNGVALALNMADFVYYRFTLKRATAEVFDSFANEKNKAILTFQFMYDYWPATLLWIVLMGLMMYFYPKVKLVRPNPGNRLSYHMVNFLFMPVLVGLTVAGLRGGFRHSTRPITISHAAKYTENPRNVPLVLNTPFSILRTFNKKTLKKPDYFTEDELDAIYNPHYIPHLSDTFQNKNIIIIILESYSREYIGAYNHDLEGGTYQGYTPFLDSLIAASNTYSVTLANGRKSIDAMPSILASIPSLETPYTISHYSNNRINGMPTLLKQKGYYSAFFHGAPNGSMGFDSFAKMAGFDDYYGLDEYPDKNDFDGIWGVWDEEFFQFFAKKINTFPEPFFLSIFSVSSHHPFKLPERYEGKFEEGPLPVLKTVRYTDHALKLFFDTIKDKPWFKNTIFVITADHASESIHKEFQNDYGYFSIPIIFYIPGSGMQGMGQKIAQQIDIMPTLLNYLHYDREYIAFGNDLFNDSTETFAFNTSASVYHLFYKDHLLEMVNGDGVSLYNYIKDRFLSDNLLGKEEDLRHLMETKLRAIIQSYNTRLIDNDLIVRQTDSIISRSLSTTFHQPE